MRSPYHQAFLDSKNQMGFAVITLLAWIAYCDGEVSAEERSAVESIASNAQSPVDWAQAVQVAGMATTADLQLACEVIRHLPEKARVLFMQMALGVALEDRILRAQENHALRFLADLLGITSATLQDLFQQRTGHPFPLPSDLSDPAYWRAPGQRPNEGMGDSSRRQDQKSQSNGSAKMDRVRALSILGLADDASANDIKSAYRRLAKIHHPDRFTELGAEAVQAATQTFQRIQAAYQYLTT